VSTESATVRRSLRQTRVRANLPRYAVWGVIAILALAGVRAIVSGPPPTPPAPTVEAPGDLAAESFAEAFTRAYLTWDPDAPEQREQRVATYASGELDAGAGLSPPADAAQEVQWTATVDDRREGPRRRTITVQAQTSDELVYVAVPVERDKRGFLFVAGYPALVGAPAVNTAASARVEPEIEDTGLEAVARRAITNYLAGELIDLRADLAPNARVSLPERKLKVISIDAVTWAKPNERVAVQLDARGEDNTLWTLRYELGVRRTERWYVRSVSVDPTSGGGNR